MVPSAGIRTPTSRVFVDQAAHKILSATLTPSTAAGGADGERWAGEPAVSAAGDQRLLHAVQLVQLALQRGDARRALGHRQRVIGPTSPHEVHESK